MKGAHAIRASASRGRFSASCARGTRTSMCRGFTLIEVIVAISLLAFGLALSFGTLRGASKATERAEILSQRDERLRAVQGFLRTQLNAALPIAFAFDNQTGSATFLRLSQKKLEFVAAMPGYMSRGGPYLQTLELVEGGKGQQLLFRQQLLTTEGPVDDDREPVVLLDGIADGGFRIRRLDESSKPGDWQPEWNESAQLPPLVRLDVRFLDASRHWPEFVVAPRLAATAGATEAVPLAADAANNR